jgi:peptidase E
MKLFLFGGSEIDKGQFLPQLKLIETVILECKPKQVLHVPFARTIAKEVEWEGDWFNKYIILNGIEYLNAAKPEDIERAKNPLVFLNGGGENINLFEKINSNKRLLDLVMNADYLIGESAGAKILGKYFRAIGGDDNSQMMPGLNIIKDSVIEPHYTERNRQPLLIKDLKDSDAKYGLGVDSMTAVVFEVNDFPNKITRIGEGSYELKIKD